MNHSFCHESLEIRIIPVTCIEVQCWKKHTHTLTVVALYHVCNTGQFQTEITSLPQTLHTQENKNLMKTSINH